MFSKVQLATGDRASLMKTYRQSTMLPEKHWNDWVMREDKWARRLGFAHLLKVLGTIDEYSNRRLSHGLI